MGIRKMFIVVLTLIFVIITVLPLIPYDSYETLGLGILLNSYQAIIKQLVISLILISIVATYCIAKEHIYLDKVGRVLYISISLCILSGIIYCINIYCGYISIIDLDKLDYYKSNSKNSYYEMDLSQETNSKECMFYSPTLYYYENTVVYLNCDSENANSNKLLFYRDIFINKSKAFMVINIDDENKSEEENAEYIIKVVKDLKAEYTIGKTVLMGEGKGADLAVFTSSYGEVDGAIAIYPNEYKYTNKIQDNEIKSPILLVEGNDKSYKTVIKEDKNINYIQIPGSNNKFNDSFIRYSIIGDLFKKEFIKYLEHHNV